MTPRLGLVQLLLEELRQPGAAELRKEVATLLAPELKISAPAPEPLLTLAEVAKLLGCRRAALQERFRRARKNGGGHPLEQPSVVIKIDGVRRWRRGDVERFIAGGQR